MNMISEVSHASPLRRQVSCACKCRESLVIQVSHNWTIH